MEEMFQNVLELELTSFVVVASRRRSARFLVAGQGNRVVNVQFVVTDRRRVHPRMVVHRVVERSKMLAFHRSEQGLHGDAVSVCRTSQKLQKVLEQLVLCANTAVDTSRLMLTGWNSRPFLPAGRQCD
jgi:hypothetical protein